MNHPIGMQPEVLYNKTNALDWEYISEGGKHAIFAFHPTNQKISNRSVELFRNRVLRIDKQLFQSDAKELQSPPRARLQGEVFQDLFLLGVDKNYPYLDPPLSIRVDQGFLQELKNKAVGSRKIPFSRRLDWKSSSKDKGLYDGNANDASVTCTLLPNYRVPKTLSVEIKPKAGYLATSPLVHLEHGAKYHVSRFQILQQLNHKGFISKGWNKGTALRKKSSYDPLDLFSSNGDRIHKALNALFAYPQNNFKVYFGDNVIHSHDSVQKGNDDDDDRGCGAEIYNEVLDTVFYQSCQKQHSWPRHKEQSTDLIFKNELVDVLSEILEKDPFLRKLLSLQQRYDILDVDGAILVYNRLVSLCNGNNEEAEELVEMCPGVTGFEGSSDLSCKKDPVNGPLFALRGFLDSNKWSESRSGDITNIYKEGQSLVDNLNTDDCAVLLRDWLQSLTLCDICFFVLIKSNVKDSIDSGKLSQKILLRSGKLLQYEIKVVDYDIKPARKLRNREKGESKIALFKRDL